MLLFLVFYKSNEGFSDNEISKRFTGPPYKFHNKYTLKEQEIQETLNGNIEKCVRDYNNELFKIGHGVNMCPPDKPRCLGGSHPGHWGVCHPKNVLKCKDDYNEATYNNGNGTGRFMCPSTHPKCYNYSETDSRLGTCIRRQKERFLKNCTSDYDPNIIGSCPEYISKCVFNPSYYSTNAPNSTNASGIGICAHKEFHNTSYYDDYTSGREEGADTSKYPICSRNYITNNENDNDIFLSLQQRDYTHNPRSPENRHPFHGNSVCPITEPICVGHSDNVWGQCQSSGIPSTHASAHPAQGSIREDGSFYAT